jgi:hypothetical protein
MFLVEIFQKNLAFGSELARSGLAAAPWVRVRLHLQLRCAACCDENNERQVWLGPRGFGQGLSLLTTPAVTGWNFN